MIKVNIPENEIGDWSIKKFNCPLREIYRPYCSENRVNRIINEPEENFTVLFHKTYLISMIDSRAMYNEHQSLIQNATGKVLLGGLGMGFDNEILMTLNNIESVTIIEKSQEVIDLVWPYCKKDERFTLIHDDIFTWNIPANSHWNYMWCDIYVPLMNIDHSQYITDITNKYSSCVDKIDFWS